ncbi:MAG: hypothetical protein Q4D55_11120 [Eubacteriales bacterium]|nr:hypothetical protein [Eubacteriales bacterium]
MKRYGNDYRRGASGYEYTGEWYKSRRSLDQVRRQALASAAPLLLACAAFVAALSFENEAGRVFWVLLPFVSMIFPLAYGLMGSFSLYLFCKRQEEGSLQRSDGRTRVVVPEGHEGEMVRAEYEKGVRRPWRSALALTILSLLSLGGDLCLIIFRHGELALKQELLFALLCFGIFLCSLWTLWKTDKIRKNFCVFLQD